MDFRIADTFTDSLAKLTGEEQKAVKTTAFDLQLNPANPGLSFHKLDHAKDKNFWSVRVNSDLRLIVHRSPTSLLLCYVDHHNKAYQWAERRKLETHPTTGAAQLVEIRERIEEIVVPKYIETPQPAAPKLKVFAHIPESQLLGYGVPAEWLEDVRKADEDTLLELADHLPGEAAEALLDLATGSKPQIVQTPTQGADPFQHPDALRRFRLMSNVEELARALDYPWEKWMVFLHPDQRRIVERDYAGPARVSGSAGTGKTIVALHRAVHLARRNPDARVLLTTFSGTLANALRRQLRLLIGSEPRLAERLEVHGIDAIAQRLHERCLGPFQLAGRADIRALIEAAAAGIPDLKFRGNFLHGEWEQVIDPWQLRTWEDYREVRRLGRKARLSEAQRALLWQLYEQVWTRLDRQGLTTPSGLFGRLAHYLGSLERKPFDAVVVDEAQDMGPAQLRFVAALAGDQANGLFFAGDLGQRIFQQAFSWKALGVDVRGRSRTLNLNYRTSHQIRRQADRLLSPEIADVDGNTEVRSGTVSIFNGPPPLIARCGSQGEEAQEVVDWLGKRLAEGLKPHELAVIVRSTAELERAMCAVEPSGIPFRILDPKIEPATGSVSLVTMPLAKGLEFRAVAVMACDDEIMPSQARIETVGDEADLQEVYDTERHLLYVACTRARDHLLITSGSQPSEFLDDLEG